MGDHRMPCHRKPLNHTFGVGLVAGSITLSGVGLLLPATANAEVQVGGQTDSAGSAGGNRTAVNISNNTYVIGRNNNTGVNQTNQNSVGGNGNSTSGGRVIRIPDVVVGGQKNSPGAAGGTRTALRVSNNTIVVGRGNNTSVDQADEDCTGGSDNSSIGGDSDGGEGMQVGGQSSSPGAAGGNRTGVDISNNTYVVGRNNTTVVNQVNQNWIRRKRQHRHSGWAQRRLRSGGRPEQQPGRRRWQHHRNQLLQQHVRRRPRQYHRGHSEQPELHRRRQQLRRAGRRRRAAGRRWVGRTTARARRAAIESARS